MSMRFVGGSLVDKDDDASDLDTETQRHNAMMYAARMRYLDESDQIKPDVLFMTRKQAQKLAQHQNSEKVFKKLEVSRKAPPPVGWKKSIVRNAEEKSESWIKCFQAGCHYWQNQETGECRLEPPSGHGDALDEAAAQDDDEQVPFPEQFQFLEDDCGISPSKTDEKHRKKTG